jgi:hypothetical protein
MEAPALPVVSAVLAGGAVVVHRPSCSRLSVVGASCPVPVVSLSFRCCSGATLGGWILDGGSRYAVPLLGRRCFPRVVVSDQVAMLGHFVLTWHARGTWTHCSSSAWRWVLRRPLFVVARWSWRCLLLSWRCGCALSSPASFHPSSTPRAVARGAGGGRCVVVLGPAGSFPVVWVCWCRRRRWHRSWIVVVGSFLIIVGAHHHPLALPNLQAGACSGGNGWWVGIFCFGGFERVIDVARLWGSLSAYRVGIPLLGSPGIPLRPPSLCRQPRIPFEQGGGLGGCGRALRVFRRCRLSLVEYNLSIKEMISS